MKKSQQGGFLLAVVAGWVGSLIVAGPVWASGDFEVDSRVAYTVEEDGGARVEQRMEVVNLRTEKYLEEFVVEVEGKRVEEVAAVGEGGEDLEVTEGGEGETSRLAVKLPAVTGKGRRQSWVLSYRLKGVAEAKGDVWEVSLPRIEAGQYKELVVEVRIPASLGKLAFAHPDPKRVERDGGETVLIFDKVDMRNSGVMVVFGEMQVFDVSLKYYLENQGDGVEIRRVAIPPDTDFQRVVYRGIDPLPEDVQVDKDGNWLAVYKLASGSSLEVRVQVQVQVFAVAKPLEIGGVGGGSDFSEWLKPDEFWEVGAETIEKLAVEHTTPRQIYDWVIATLEYDYDRVGSWEARGGALSALNHPKHSICSDYTDLFIAVARAAGIPARQVIGYAYSIHPRLKPLALVKDILHTWPEYWDGERGMWVPIDPTWGETTGGGDYFNQLDLNHVKFVNLGRSSSAPLPPGAYKSGRGRLGKDIEVELGELTSWSWSPLEVKLEVPFSWPFGEMRGGLEVVNLNRVAGYRQWVELEPRFLEVDRKEVVLGVVPPFGRRKVGLMMVPDEWTWYQAEIGLKLGSEAEGYFPGSAREGQAIYGEQVVRLPVWVKAVQAVVILGGGGVGGFILYRLSNYLRSIRRAVGRKTPGAKVG